MSNEQIEKIEALKTKWYVPLNIGKVLGILGVISAFWGFTTKMSIYGGELLKVIEIHEKDIATLKQTQQIQQDKITALETTIKDMHK